MPDDNVIEFNGKRYDASTGELLGKSHTSVAEPLPPARVSPRNIDGVVRASSLHSLHESASAKRAARRPIRHDHGKPVKAHRPQAAKTLMRRAVHKPAVTMKQAIKTQAPTELMARPVSAVAMKHSVHTVDPLRQHRATKTPKSQAVKHFTSSASPVAQPHIFEPVAAPVQASKHLHKQALQHTKPDIFEAAIARANSHEQPHVQQHSQKHRRRRRLAGVTTLLVVCLMLGGLLTYLNLSGIEMKIASFQAGFTAQLPSHNPTGYELVDIKQRPGQIVLHYRSGDRNFQLTQQPTDWNSQTLGDQIIATAGSEHIQSKGRTIYIYDDIASWVSGGVRYDITGNAQLGKDDIAAIAGSM
ncbi:MAG TPA: hypothetical protein VFB59_05140 [Candidatus Saccharimonadales bacterium]|nr:hypothetical protein [Candidatus Saccharimonadales bacterium]